jgi:hypothetical protein
MSNTPYSILMKRRKKRSKRITTKHSIKGISVTETCTCSSSICRSNSEQARHTVCLIAIKRSNNKTKVTVMTITMMRRKMLMVVVMMGKMKWILNRCNRIRDMLLRHRNITAFKRMMLNRVSLLIKGCRYSKRRMKMRMVMIMGMNS